MFSFKTKWYRIGNSKKEWLDIIPVNETRRTVVNRTPVCLVNHNDDLFAVNDRCPHQGASLSNGGCAEDGKIVCPFHRYGFDLKNGRGAGLYVDVYPIEEREDGLYLGMEYFSWFG
jgi:nitrite reductase/ring-hydroxylating ferredoxin subunit